MEPMVDDVKTDDIDVNHDVARLEERIVSYGSAVVGFSGGIPLRWNSRTNRMFATMKASPIISPKL